MIKKFRVRMFLSGRSIRGVTTKDSVTRLGKFSPIERLLTLGITEEAQFLAIFTTCASYLLMLTTFGRFFGRFFH
jgi:hypothetical protein